MPSTEFELLTNKRPPKKRPEYDQQDWSIIIGILCTLLLHVVAAWVIHEIPIDNVGKSPSELAALAAKRKKSFDFELAPIPPPPPKPNPIKFVQTNPDAPENTPDKTPNFSNHNQQAAQKEPPKEKDPENRPSVKGQDEIKNDADILTGDHAKAQDGATATSNSSQVNAPPQAASQARAEHVPLSGTENLKNESREGIGASVSHNPAPTTNANDLVEGAREGKNATGGLTTAADNMKPHPRARPRLTQAPSTILQNRLAGASNVGVIASDAFKSEYGDYLAELREIVEVEWNGILEEGHINPKVGTHVFVRFKLNSKGEVQISQVEETAGEAGAHACTGAITNRAPYRKWTEQMVTLLGDEQDLGFDFYYVDRF
ncbi:MAG TPA: hypothetical protein VHD32_10155 [Candidatus Didemnitutus sp.]|nr:hypothetical protein [Candidatus Didemnitutus sp.]